jgi:hypothetical protein
MHPKTLRRYFDRHAGATGEVTMVREQIVIIIDAFYFSRGDGVLVCRTIEKVLHWREVATERIEDYAACLDTVTAMGRTVLIAVIDGRRGVRQMFLARGIIVQCCQFHQILTIKKYIPGRAKTEAARTLRAIAFRLSDSMSTQFEIALDIWKVLYGEFLNEKTYGTANKRRWQYTHCRLRSAYRSLRTNLPWLFTFERYPQLQIPNTTNHCDGLFAHIEERIGIHRGLSRARRKKMLDYLLERYLP